MEKISLNGGWSYVFHKGLSLQLTHLFIYSAEDTLFVMLVPHEPDQNASQVFTYTIIKQTSLHESVHGCGG